MIYVGYYDPDIPLAFEMFPVLKTMCEKDLLNWVKEDPTRLFGTWINHAHLIDYCEHEDVIVIGPTLKRAKLTDCVSYNRWHQEFNPGELYSLVGADWVV